MAMGLCLEAVFIRMFIEKRLDQKRLSWPSTLQVIAPAYSCAIAPPGLIVRVQSVRSFPLSMNNPG